MYHSSLYKKTTRKKCCRLLFLLLIIPAGIVLLNAGDAYGSQPNRTVSGDRQVFTLERTNLTSWSLDISTDIEKKNLEFEHTPDYEGDEIFTGYIPLGDNRNNHVPFAWDVKKHTVFLDLNRNLDLTDDGENGINSHPFLEFPDETIHVDVMYGDNKVPLEISLSLLPAGGNHAMCILKVRTAYQDIITLDGKKWYMVIVDNLDGIIEPEKGGRHDRLIFIPYDNDSLLNHKYIYDLHSLNLRNHVFLDDTAYKIEYTSAPETAHTMLTATFSEIEQELGTLTIKGSMIKTLFLGGENAMPVILLEPSRKAEIPVATYNMYKVFLHDDTTGASAWGNFGCWFEINEDKPCTLETGAPLENTIQISADGRRIEMDYDLVGQNNKSFTLVKVSIAEPPEFVVYKGDKELKTGRFRYG